MSEVGKNINFLQSEEWRKFQAAVGCRTFLVSSQKSPSNPPFEKGEDLFGASIIEHKLPVVGRYFYIPRGIIFNFKFSTLPTGRQVFNQAPVFNDQIKKFFSELINLAKKEKVSWIRFDASDEKFMDICRNSLKLKVVKAPHDMQSREVFVIDVTKSEEELLKEMSSKTRYNIRLAEKKGVSLRITNPYEYTNDEKYLDEFLRLVKVTSERQGIMSHPEKYYRKMFEIIPKEIIKLYVAEYENKIIAANIVIFYGDTATYLHGASDNAYRNVMAPFLLQWRAIQDAKKVGCHFYDLGGIKTNPKSQIPNSKQIQNSKFKIQNSASNGWQGITKFKTGFSPNTKPTEFSGSYDIIINPFKYNLYRLLQKIKSFLLF